MAIYSRHLPDRVVLGLGIEDIDAQGRYLQLDFANLSVASVYFPSGSRWKKIRKLVAAGQPIYWRVAGKTSSKGIVTPSDQVFSFVIMAAP